MTEGGSTEDEWAGPPMGLYKVTSPRESSILHSDFGSNKMKLAVFILGAVLATALAQDGGMPNIPNMPNINMLNNFKDGKMPEIPPGLKIDDLKEAFYNLPPSMKDKLNEMAQSFGMQLDDVEDALNNPPEKLKEYFDKNAKRGAKSGGQKQELCPQPVELSSTYDRKRTCPWNQQKNGPKGDMGGMGDILKNIDMGAMSDMLKDVDINSLMSNIDPSTISGLMQNMDMGSMGDIMKNMDMGAMGDIMKNVDMGAMSDMMKNVDIGGIMKNMDMGAMGDIMKNVDVGSMMKNLDMGSINKVMEKVDVPKMMKGMDMGSMGGMMGSMMKNMDMGSISDMMKNVDIGGIMKNMDMGAMTDIMKNMDMGAMSDIMQNMDMGAMGDIMKNLDMGGAMGDIMKNVDIGSMMKNIDMGAMTNMMKNMDMGAMGDIMKNMDMGAIAGMMKNVDVGSMMNMAKDLDVSSLLKGKLPSFDAIKSIFGVPADADYDEIKSIIREKLNAAGVPLDSPMKLLEFVQEKVKGLPLPEDMDPSAMLNMIHGQLEAMDIPEDPSKLQEFVFEKAGLGEIKDIEELRDPEILAKIIQKKAFAILGLDENEDPNEVKDRIHKQLLDEAKKLGAALPDDYTKDDVMQEMDKVLTKQINEMLGTDAKSVVPDELHTAVLGKLQNMGFPIGNMQSLKKHVIDLAMKHLMKQAVPMVMNFFMPKPRPQMPPQRPMMPPMMPPTVPLNLEIEVNVEQPPSMQMPRYLSGVEQAVHHPELDQFDDAMVYHHIMAVRQALRYGEMPEEVLQEMVEDLMNARLKARVLSVRNMFLSDRIEAMEEEMAMASQPPMNPLRRMMRPRAMRPRVL